MEFTFLDGVGDAASHVHGVDLNELPTSTTLLVWTWNSMYRVVVIRGCHVTVQGGEFFRDSTFAHVNGATIGGNCLKVGWIGVGLLIEFAAAGTRIVTSPVLAITIQPRHAAIVH
jgi:hypothetical protein